MKVWALKCNIEGGSALETIRNNTSRPSGHIDCGDDSLDLSRGGKNHPAARQPGRCIQSSDLEIFTAAALPRFAAVVAFPHPQRAPELIYGAVLSAYYKDMRTILALFAVSAALPLLAQTPSRYVSVVGTVTSADAAGHVFAVKTDKSGDTTVKFDDKTSFLRLPVGETDVKKATPAKSSDVGPGDRILARVHTEDPTGQPALTFYITKQADIAQRNQKTLEEWKTQSVAGSVRSVDPATKQIVIAVRGAFGPPKDVTLDASAPAVTFERYRPDAAKYEMDTIASIQPGDQLRVLGTKNADVTQIKAEAIMSGSFRTVPVQIKSIDAASGQIMATDLASKKPITIIVRADTALKKLDDATAAMMARRLNPNAAAGGRGQGRGAAPDAAAGGAPGGGRGRGAGRGGDPTTLLESQPTIQLSDLKAGDPVVVTGSSGADMTKLTATSLVAGVEPILRAAPANGPDPLGGSWNLGDGGPPQ